MKNKLYILYIVIFFAICTAPLILMPLTYSSESAENRTLADAPEIIADGGFNMSVGSDTENWLADHFAFRSPIVTAYARLKAALFASSAEDSVIIGRDGWLFFDETVADYTGSEPMTERELSALAGKLALMREYIESCGGRFVFTVAPNKNSIYPNFMPARFVKSNGASNAQRLAAMLRENGVTYVDLFAALDEAAQSAQIYHKLDTHWNNLGAAIACGLILDAADTAHVDYAAMDYTVAASHSGDLWGMLYPALTDTKDDQVDFGVNFTYEYTSRFRTVEDLTIKTACGTGENSLLIFRDSFCNSMLPFFAETFKEAAFLRGVPYQLEQAQGADVIVVETVERNLDVLSGQMTVFPAPKRDFDGSMVQNDAIYTLQTLETSGGQFVSGEIAGDVTVGTRVFIESGGTFWEACCVGERGFYAYGIDAGDIRIYIIK